MNSGVGEAMPQPYADVPGKATNPVIPACAGEPTCPGLSTVPGSICTDSTGIEPLARHGVRLQPGPGRAVPGSAYRFRGNRPLVLAGRPQTQRQTRDTLSGYRIPRYGCRTIDPRRSRTAPKRQPRRFGSGIATRPASAES